MARKTPEYVALSTYNAQTGGYVVLARGHGKVEIACKGDAEIDRRYPDRLNIWGDTLRKNLHVVSISQARRTVGLCALGECDHFHEEAE